MNIIIRMTFHVTLVEAQSPPHPTQVILILTSCFCRFALLMEHLPFAQVLPLPYITQTQEETQIHLLPEMFHAHKAFLGIINFADHLECGVRERIYII